VRIALRKAVADFQGIDNDEPNIVTVPIFEDTTDESKPVRCEPGLPPEASVSSTLTPDELEQVFN
jgi:ribose transport system substrate-binding protein